MDPRKVAVILVCADLDESTLEPVVERLCASGYEVGLVAGVDTQPRLVGEALDRCGPRGVIVACTSRRLDAPVLRKIEGVFGARRGPDHALVKVELGASRPELVAAIQRATEAYAAHHGQLVRPPAGSGSGASTKREVIPIAGLVGVAMPVVRLSAEESVDGDTGRIELVDNPTAAELSRRRRAAREHEREREQVRERKPGPSPATEPDVEVSSLPNSLTEQIRDDAARLDRVMIATIVGAGLLAVLAALSFSGAL